MAIYKCKCGNESEGQEGLKNKFCRRCLKEMYEIFEDNKTEIEIKDKADEVISYIFRDENLGLCRELLEQHFLKEIKGDNK